MVNGLIFGETLEIALGNCKPIGLGTAAFGGVYGGGLEQDEADAIVAEALAAGITHFDTAPFYAAEQSSEAVLGKALAASGVPRSSYTVASKVCRGRDANGQSTHETTAEAMAASLATSAAALGGPLDVVLVHDIEFLDYATLVDEVLPRLRTWRDDGSSPAISPATRIGVAGYPLDTLARATRDASPDAVQAYATATLLDARLESDAPGSVRGAIGECLVAPHLFHASVTGMGLLTPQGPQPWHPLHGQPRHYAAVSDAVAAAVEALAAADLPSLPDVALYRSLAAHHAGVGTTLLGPASLAQLRSMLAVVDAVASGSAAIAPLDAGLALVEGIISEHLAPLDAPPVFWPSGL
ncbi:L-galactose dehydrogenase [Thecamonas trahens ATCC 50062]|uniref:L-galactose dehydrogenase n=1 Tax=Thecamonas trahens ATCC 50062 TaxID=461836 RepID=A0A0L0DJB0_THETB|nr:L-galactose dehydrogenase [Thecamonas trahens ATCC 50062]KNC51413.1 L-galactose dehydrogenase [Thecamonas trahens ATCC 50062]|eukprot:XP_013756080.1 L-galactose dehydrogenase [Thecamonas trahens ATCC 50062]